MMLVCSSDRVLSVNRKPGEIGIQTIRAADIVGEHTVYFAGPGERIETLPPGPDTGPFCPRGNSAAAWLEGKTNGMYSMFDVLDLKDF